MAKRSKGQMFIVTVVFLVGLVFVVQQILLQYSYLDVPTSYKEDDYQLMKGAESIIIRAVTKASTCAEAEKNLEESLLFLGEQTTGGHSLKVDYSINCTNWNNVYPEPGPVTAKIMITSEKAESINNIVLYSEGANPCTCTGWVELGCGSDFGCPDTFMRRTRTCDPSLCDTESECNLDITACSSITCRITASGELCAPSEVDVLHISSLINAHAELPSQSIYPFRVCCSGPGIGNDCAAPGATSFLSLSSPTNAHVEYIAGVYTEQACFSGAATTCGYTVPPQDCDDVYAGSACLVSVSAPTNAHVASCTGAGAYETKVCCWIG